MGSGQLSKTLHQCSSACGGIPVIATVPMRYRNFRSFGIGVLIGVALVTLVCFAAL
jgi:hypothetical protein